MPTFYDSTGKAHVLTREIGRGGEGTVYFCEGNTELVAKIYHEPVTEEKARKLRWMAENNNERLLKVAAWVVEILYDKPDGQIVGFLMPSINAKEIHELYSLKSRRVHFPDANWHFLIHTATNVARAFYSLQKYEHVMGDVNHGNCVVLPDGTVKLIDCDSYAIKANGNRYACEVGVATHLAPELQKQNLSEIERLPHHDNFGLAVIIFQLLFLGRHPFSGNYQGEKDKTLEDCIREYRFAYGKNASKKKVKQPPGTLSLKEVSPRIAKLFERAFDEKPQRPSPKEWIEALTDLSENLEQCAFHPGHHFYNNLASCPWCKIEQNTGLILFPFNINSENGDGEKPFNIYTVENLIANINTTKRDLPAKLPVPNYSQALQPTSEIVSKALKERNIKILIGVLYVISIIIAFFVFEFFIVCIFNFLLLSFCIYLLNRMGNPVRKQLDKSLTKLQNELEMLQNKWAKFLLFDDSDKVAAKIRKEIDDYRKLQKKSVEDLKMLRLSDQRDQFNKYLRSRKIANADSLDINKDEINLINKKGITNASQIEESRLLYFYQIDENLIQRLLVWREKVEKEFQYDPKSKTTISKKDKFMQDIAEKRESIEKDIDKLLKSIGSGSTQFKEEQEKLTSKSKQYREAISQIETNKETLGDPLKTITALVYASVLITFVFPFLGFVFSEGHFFTASNPEYYRKDISDSYDPPPPPIYGDTSQMSSSEIAALKVPYENITDEEISELDYFEREKYANNLFRQATNLISRRLNYQKAEEKLKLSIRLNKNIENLNELGMLLHNTKKYEESLEFLKDALEIDESNNLTKIYLGLNYMELKKYEEAVDIFERAARNEGSYLPYYNLGLAHKELKNYKKAEAAFMEVIKINGSDANSIYELGHIYHKLNDSENFNKQYAELLNLDEAKAEELLENTYKTLPKKKNNHRSRRIRW